MLVRVDSSLMLGDFLACTLPYTLRQGLSLHPDLTNQATEQVQSIGKTCFLIHYCIFEWAHSYSAFT